MNTKNKLADMPIRPLLYTMAVPLMLSLLVQSLYNIVDSMFVARLSETTLTATSLVYSIQFLMIAVGVGTAVGLNALLSRKIGQHKPEEACQTATTGLFLMLITSLIFSIAGIFFSDIIAAKLTPEQELQELCRQYLSINLVYCWGIFLQTYGQRLLQAVGDTLLSMLSLIIGAVLNIILDPIMIFGLLGLPKLGATGAAVATVVGQCVAAVVAFVCNHKFNHEISLSFKGYSPDFKIMGTIYAIGIPSIIMQSIGSIMTYAMNRILIGFSSTAAAVFGVYFKLQSFFFMPVFGLNNGITPIIAFNYGAQNRKRMVKTIKVSLITAFCLLFVGFACFEFIPQVLLGMFSASDDMLKIGVPALRIIGVHFLIAWFCIIVGTVFQALGKAVFSMIVSIMRQLVVLIPAAYILSKLGGLHAVWWAFPIAEVISFTVSTLFLIRINRTIISKIPDGSDVL